MNKADLADKERTREWSAFFKEKGFFVVSLDARSKSGDEEHHRYRDGGLQGKD